MPRENLSNRTIDEYNRFNRDLASCNFVLRFSKSTGALGPSSVRTLNGLIVSARRLFRDQAELPRFTPLAADEPLSQSDASILVARLTLCALAFEKTYQHHTRGVSKPPALSGAAALYAKEGLPSPHL